MEDREAAWLQRTVERRLCQILWEAFDDFDATALDRWSWVLDDLRDHLAEALPYSSEDVKTREEGS